MARIAVDAMGGDFAPRAPIAGAIHALAELAPEHDIELVGRASDIEAELDALFADEFAENVLLRIRLHVIDAPDVIEMHDKPSVVVRGKTKSSMVVGLARVADGLAHAAQPCPAQSRCRQFERKVRGQVRHHAGVQRGAELRFYPSVRIQCVLRCCPKASVR